MNNNINNGNIFLIGDKGDFKIYLPPANLDQKDLDSVKNFNEINIKMEGDILQKISKRINCSFIYAHPPDYVGLPMVKASVTDWQEKFVKLKEMHIDSVIFQASIWLELNECYYISKKFDYMHQYPVIERMLEAAKLENMTVYLGGLGSTLGWKNKISQEYIDYEIQKHYECFRELVKLGNFSGIYFPCETAFEGKYDKEKAQSINYMYRKLASFVKDYNPMLKVMVSPATKFYADLEQEFIQHWNSILSNSNIDILMPQDSIGCCSCSLKDMDKAWNTWFKIAQNNQIELWSNIELFERRSFFEDINLYPASVARVSKQLELTDKYVNGRCCWEAMYFASSQSGEDGEKLGNYLRSI